MTDNQATPRFPGYQEMAVGEEIADGDMLVQDNGSLKPSICQGLKVYSREKGMYFRPIPVTPAAAPNPNQTIFDASPTRIHTHKAAPNDAEALASSLVDVLSAENADLKAKLATLQNLYDDAAEEDMLRGSREEAAFRAGFLAGTSFGMDQASDDRMRHSDSPDENQAWEEYRNKGDAS